MSEQVIECIFPHPQGRRSIITRQKTQTQLLQQLQQSMVIPIFYANVSLKVVILNLLTIHEMSWERESEAEEEREWERKRKSVRFLRYEKCK